MATIAKCHELFEACWIRDIEPKIAEVIGSEHMEVVKSACLVAYAQGRVDDEQEHRAKIENIFAQFDTPEAIDKTAEKLMEELNGA